MKSRSFDKCKKSIFAVMALSASALLLSAAVSTDAALAESSDVVWNGKVIAELNEENQIVYTPSDNSNTNYKNITHLIEGNEEKTIVFPQGSTIYLNGVLRPGSNTTIIADGCTIYAKAKSNVIFCAPNKNLTNIHIQGGTWRSPDKNGRTGSLLAFAFVKNLVLDGIDCNANYVGHAIEIIACNNVTIKNSTVTSIGKNPANCHEEAIQIDISTKKTAPKIASYGKKYVNGQTCSNIYLLNNKVYGARAIGVNWTNSESGKWANKFHKNIVVKGNHLTGTTSEALSIFNTIGGEVSDNTIITKSKRKTSNYSYTIGLHLGICGIAPSKMKSSTFTIQNNKIYGYRNGIHVKGYFPSESKPPRSKFGKVIIKNNTVYCKKGKKNAIAQVKKSCKKFTVKGNTVKKWK